MRDLSVELQWELTASRFEEWLKNELFHFKWWILLCVFILSVVIWWKCIDKSRLSELVLCAGIVCIFVLVLDELGEELALWEYPVKIFPLFPPISAIDLASLPFLYSLIYQYFGTWKSYAIASAVMSVLSCFVMEPLFILSGIYQLITWKTYYGMPVYFAIAISTKWIMVRLKKMEAKAG